MEALKRHEPLYLKHRPQALDELVGQTAVTRTLTNAILNDRIAHAYLFTGPRGTGKTSSARILAKSLNCKATEKATTTPCQQCASCLEIRNGTSPAVFEIDAASNNSVDDARVLIERAPLVAPGGRYKIYIIDECHMLTKEAFNALLKTIEDPPPNVIFVLATTEEHKVLPTIVSRCQRLMFRLVSQDDLTAHLRNVARKESIEITDDALALVARRSGGGLRDALGLLDQASLLSAPGAPVTVNDLLNLLGALHEDVLLQVSEHVLHRNGNEVLQAVNKLLQDGREPAVIVQELSRHFLNLMKASYITDDPGQKQAMETLIVGSPEYLTGLRNLAGHFDRSELSQMVEQLDRLEQTCRRTTQPAMHLEIGLLSLCHRHEMLLVRELAERVSQLERGIAPSPTQAVKAQQQSQVSKPIPKPAPAPESAPAPPVQVAPTIAPETPRVPQETIPTAQETPAPQFEETLPTAQETPQAQSEEPIAIAEETETAEPEKTAQPAAQPIIQSVTVAEASQTEATASDSESTTSLGELDRIWSDMLDQLQRKHIPTFSVASMHAFPISLAQTELVIGVPNETLQRTLEGKAAHIKNVTAQVIGREVHVKFRVVAREVAPVPAKKPSRPVETPVSQAAAGDDDDYRDDEPSPPAAPMMAQSSLAVEPAANDGTIIKEAYRLFEGPGSRRLGAD